MLIDYKDRRPIYEQIESGLTEMIARGVMGPGEQLPSVRNLAMELAINPNTIQRAYNELEQKGIIYCVKGKGNFVADMKELEKIRRQQIEEEFQLLVDKAAQYGWSREEMEQELESAWQRRNAGAERKESAEMERL